MVRKRVCASGMAHVFDPSPFPSLTLDKPPICNNFQPEKSGSRALSVRDMKGW